jgi:Alpha-aminoadipate carrier protein LysW-like, globular domain
MPKGICIHCKSIFDISDDIVECTACGAVMRVVEWNPFELELLEPGAGDSERVIAIRN